MKVLIISPQFAPSAGGVQRYSAALASALIDLLGAENCGLHSLLDSSTPFPCKSPFVGAAGNKLRFAIKLLQRCILDRPKLLWFTHANLAPLGLFINRTLGIPYIVSAHGVEVWKPSRPDIRQALRKARVVCSVSSFTAEQLFRQHLVTANRHFILPNTVDETRFSFADKLKQPLEGKPFTLLTINRFERQEEYKGYNVVLQAFPQLAASIPNLRWIVGGTGNDWERFRQEVAISGFRNQIELPGFIAEADLPSLYASADLFVMPSVLEGFGIVYLEAMCCGTPCLAGNRDGARDPLRHGKLGFCVDPYSPDKIAEAIISYWNGESPISCLSSETLRQQSIQKFGTAAFRRRLKRLLAAIG